MDKTLKVEKVQSDKDGIVLVIYIYIHSSLLSFSLVILDSIIVVNEFDIPRSPRILRDEFSIIWWAFVLIVRCQDALEAHTDAFNSLYW